MVGRGKAGHFGPLVIGQEQYDAEMKVVAKGEETFGSAVLGDTDLGPKKRAPAPAAAERSDTGEPAKVELPANLDKFRTALFAADQRTADGLLAAELARPDGPRLTALRMLLEAEQARENGGRPEFLRVINDGIARVT